VTAIAGRARGFFAELRDHARIVWALLLRELATRFGRDNLGFLWIVAEPLVFCGAVVMLWQAIKAPYEHGLPITPFVVTGYMPIILVRHMIGQSLTCVRINAGLLYHRQITVLHLFISRLILEFIGVSLAFVVVAGVLILLGLMDPPANLFLVYCGWLLLTWITAGTALILGAVSEMVPMVERFVAALTYVLVPLSGTFYMAAWLAPAFREVVLYLPFLHPVEIIRGGLFGPTVTVYYDVGYAMFWAAALNFTGLLLLRFVRERVDLD
jgi:capsular polysaccharide transport system permease protein